MRSRRRPLPIPNPSPNNPDQAEAAAAVLKQQLAAFQELPSPSPAPTPTPTPAPTLPPPLPPILVQEQLGRMRKSERAKEGDHRRRLHDTNPSLRTLALTRIRIAGYT